MLYPSPTRADGQSTCTIFSFWEDLLAPEAQFLDDRVAEDFTSTFFKKCTSRPAARVVRVPYLRSELIPEAEICLTKYFCA